LPINPERVARITGLGLNEQQARAYLALLDVEHATVHDIARSSRVPRAKLYEVLDGLSRKGLLETIPGTPQRFRANALTALYDTRAEELRAEERQLKRTIGELMVEMLPQPRDNVPEGDRDVLHLLKGRTVFLASLRQLLERTQKSLLIQADRLALARFKLYEDIYDRLARAAGKIELRILAPEDIVLQAEGRRIHVDELVDNIRRFPVRGADVLTLVSDEQEIIEVHFLPNDLHPTRGSDRIVVYRDAAVAGARAALLRCAWDSGTPLESRLGVRRN
jgi:sugar-specific transcriptional regulator TrmB